MMGNKKTGTLVVPCPEYQEVVFEVEYLWTRTSLCMGAIVFPWNANGRQLQWTRCEEWDNFPR